MTPATATHTYLLLRAFIDELARCGMRAACTSPGSRCAPLVLSLAREERLRCYSHLDERCSGFFALGLAKASRLPVAVACTSGTAAAQLLAPAVEAREAGVPLLLLTADRPAELRENGAGQAIDQLKLFGGAAKWFFEVAAHDAGADGLRWMRTLACRAYWTSIEGRPGVVHLNFPLREPLVPDEELPREDTGREGLRPYVIRRIRRSGESSDEEALGEIARACRRGVVVAGRHERSTPLGQAAAAFAERAGWPLLADPLSGARRGTAAVAHYDALLRDEGFRRSVTPELVLRVGDLPVSKPLRSWLAELRDVDQVAIDPDGAWQDPASVLHSSLALEPARALERIAAQWPEGEERKAEEGWLETWRSADVRASAAMLGVLAEERAASEPAVAAELGVLLPEEATLFVASSMPVRDIETFWPVRADPPRVLCNRGANGIDGTISSAFGAVAGVEGPVVALIGDVALAHDIGGLIAVARLGLKLTIVLLENGGGGIFDFLAVSSAPIARDRQADERQSTPTGPATRAAGPAGQDLYTRHIATPTGLDFARAAALYGLSHERVGDVRSLRVALERSLTPAAPSGIIEVAGDRLANVELHRRLWQAVSRSLSP